MIPIHDENPHRHPPVITYAIIGLNAAVWILVQGLGMREPLVRSVVEFGLIPGELLGTVDPGTRVSLGRGISFAIDGTADWYTVLTSMFMHGSWIHVIGNMWFLWVFGDNVEDALGPVRFALFYLVCGLVATGAQLVSAPASTTPMVGASGAIGGIMGGYALLFPRVGVHLLLWFGFYVTTVIVPAYVMLGYWALLQVAAGLLGSGSNVAVWAHAGGFAAGLVLVKPMTRRDRMRELREARRK